MSVPAPLVLLVGLAACAASPVPQTDPVAPPATPSTRPVAQADATALGTLPPGVGLAIGAAAPDARLHDASGGDVRLSDWVGQGWTLIVFYRGGWCPFCNFQVRDLSLAGPEFDRRGITPLLVSVDRVEEAALTQATWTIPFPVLSDPDLAAHTAFGVVHEADAAEVERLAGYGMDVEAASGRTHHQFAIPSIFLLDPEGTVRWAHADLDYKVRPSPDQILAVFDELAEAG